MHWGIFVLFVCNSPADYLIRSAVYIASHYNVLRTRSRVRIQHVLITCFAHVFKKKVSFICLFSQFLTRHIQGEKDTSECFNVQECLSNNIFQSCGGLVQIIFDFFLVIF